MWTCSLLLLAALATDIDVKPLDQSWERYSQRWFDTRRVLLPLPEGRVQRALTALEEAAQAGLLGDLIEQYETSKSAPSLPAGLEAVRPWIAGLLNDARLSTDEWDPDEDEPDDGLQHGPSFDAAEIERWPWNDLSGTTTVHTCAVLVKADLEAIKAAENDYRSYHQNVGADYEFICPQSGSYVRGEREGQPFVGTAIRFRSDLPFPFSSFSCDLRTLNRLDTRGWLTTDIYSTSQDLYWLAGHDTYVPVRNSDGEWVRTLILRMYGFDLKGVPDSAGNRKAVLRSSLGNLKLRAERRFRAAGGKARTVEGAIPDFEVRGRK